MLETNPAPSTDVSSTMNFPKNADVMDIVEPGVEIVATLTALPTTFSQKGWRTETALNGTFDAGTWTFECVLNGTKNASVDITLHARLWKSPNPDGSGATALSDWVTSTTQYIADNQTDVVYSFSITLSSFDITNEYLFVEYCMDVGPTLSGDAAGATIQFTCDETPDTTTRELLITPSFTPAITYVNIADSGTGTDAVGITSYVSVSDSGVGTDTVAATTPISVTDSGTGTDAISIQAAIPISDSGTGTDTVSIEASLTVSDSGTGTDAVTVEVLRYVSIADSGTGTDKVRVVVELTPATVEELKPKAKFTL